MATDSPYGYVVIHEPMKNEGLHLARGLEHAWQWQGPNTPSTPKTWTNREDAEQHAANERERFPESRFVVCVLVPVEAGIQGTLDVNATEAL